jgi:hypothetical protein
MKTSAITLTFIFGVLFLGHAQPAQEKTTPAWTEADRKYLLDNLTRSKDELIEETKSLSKKQWNFKENPDRWSINQIVEHIALWEVIAQYEISVALQKQPIPDFEYPLADSLFVRDPKALKQNVTTDFTKPFTFGVPLGNNEGKNNMTWLLTMRDESIAHLKIETRNLRAHYICFGPNAHQRFMMIANHNYRHLVQIKKVKAHPDYPKK